MDAIGFGKPCWKVFERIFLLIPTIIITENEIKNFYIFISQTLSLFPCSYCKNSALIFSNELLKNKKLYLRIDILIFFFDLHNFVNKKLNYKELNNFDEYFIELKKKIYFLKQNEKDIFNIKQLLLFLTFIIWNFPDNPSEIVKELYRCYFEETLPNLYYLINFGQKLYSYSGSFDIKKRFFNKIFLRFWWINFLILNYDTFEFYAEYEYLNLSVNTFLTFSVDCKNEKKIDNQNIKNITLSQAFINHVCK